MTQRWLVLAIFFVSFCLHACSGSQEKQTDLVETEAQLVQHCKYLGTISEMPDPGKIIQAIEDYNTKNKVIERAEKLGATHIVWLNKNKTGYIVGAYQCEDPVE